MFKGSSGIAPRGPEKLSAALTCSSHTHFVGSYTSTQGVLAWTYDLIWCLDIPTVMETETQITICWTVIVTGLFVLLVEWSWYFMR